MVGVPAGAIRLPFGGSVFPKNPSPVGHVHTSGKPLVSTYGAVALLIDFRLDELCQVSQRLLPTEIAGLQWNGIWKAFLHNSSLYSPPNEWLFPVVKFRKDILNVPPTFAFN